MRQVPESVHGVNTLWRTAGFLAIFGSLCEAYAGSMSNMRIGAGGGRRSERLGGQMCPLQFSNFSPSREQPGADADLFDRGIDPLFSVEFLSRRHRRISRATFADDHFSGNQFTLCTQTILHRVADILHEHFDALVENHRADFHHAHPRLAALEKNAHLDIQNHPHH